MYYRDAGFLSDHRHICFQRRSRIRFVLLATSILALSGCETFTAADNLGGPDSVPKASDIGNHAEAVNAAVNAYIVATEGSATSTPNYVNATSTGLNYIDYTCTNYMNTIFWVDKGKKSTIGILGDIGNSTNAILGATGATATAITITAAAFGLGKDLVGRIGDSVLYALPPAEVYGLWDKMRTAFRGAWDSRRVEIASESKPFGRPEAVRVLEQYAELCRPIRLEREVSVALKTVGFNVIEKPKSEVKIDSAGQKVTVESPAAAISEINVQQTTAAP